MPRPSLRLARLALAVLPAAPAALTACGDADRGAVTVDPCADVSCPPPAPCCTDDMSGVLGTAAGACQVVDDQPVCVFPDPTVSETCDAAVGVCRAGACDATPDLCDWRFTRRLSFVDVFAVGNQEAEDTVTHQSPDACCFDLDGDGTIDNALGEAFFKLKGTLIDVNGHFREQIAGGQFNLLFDYEGLDDLVDDPWFQLTVFESFPEQLDPDAPTSGNGSFRVKRRSWLEGTHVPRLHTTGRLEGGHFTMDEGTFAFFFATPTGDSVVQLPLTDFRFEGDLSVGPNGTGLVMSGPDGVDGRGARIGGIVPFASLLEVLNNEVAFSCPCATFAEGFPPFDLDMAPMCNPPEHEDCNEEDDGLFCDVVTGDLCPIVFNIFQPDFDTDANGKKESFSAGIFMKTTSASVSQGDFCGTPSPSPSP